MTDKRRSFQLTDTEICMLEQMLMQVLNSENVPAASKELLKPLYLRIRRKNSLPFWDPPRFDEFKDFLHYDRAWQIIEAD